MATVFSTATLGLQVDATQLNKELKESERLTERALDDMSQSAKAFETRWGDITRGIKDTKRIISGILISQGFYALSNALVGAGAAALDFSRSMETAAVSLEYFVDSAVGTEDAAAKVKAYLREVNEFAARTPFNTDQVLSLSKYMQAVGVAMSQTQSVLSVITDAAAATGASNEQLQRITFALGQMITKGRIANEEIRQLANANVPIYEILQEELHLTGEQISNIGNYWIDANDAVVAILNGLNKRYDGAADRMAETLTGLTDTIIDDAKIIANEAFSDVYDKVVATTATLRDTLDYMRELSINKGMPGLFNDMTLEMDPTGALGNQLLSTAGNLRNLAQSFRDLYVAAAPVLSVLGKSLSASVNVGLLALTALSKTAEQVVVGLDKLGISSGVAGKAIASLFIAYRATKFVSLLGQAFASAGLSAYSAAAGIKAILPATLQAKSGVLALTASFATLLTYLASVAGVFATLQNSFSGLGADIGSSGISQRWDDAYAEYEKKLAAYNKAIDQYREKYQEPYTNMSDGSSAARPDSDKDKDKAGGSGSKRDKQDWVAAFDEVYDVPNADDGTAAFQDDVLADFSALLDLLKVDFEFPQTGLDLPDMPKFDFGDVFGENLWDGPVPDMKGLLRAMLPTFILAITTGVGKAFAKQVKSKKVKHDDIGSVTSKTASDKVVANLFENQKNVLKQLKHAEALFSTKLSTFQETLASLQHARVLAETTGSAADWGRLTGTLATATKQMAALGADWGEINGLRALAGQGVAELSELTAADRIIAEAQRAVLVKEQESLEKLVVSAATSTADFEKANKRLIEIKHQLTQLNNGTVTVDLSKSNMFDIAEALDKQAHVLRDAFTAAFDGPLKKAVNGARIYDLKLLQQASDQYALFNKLGTNYLSRIAAGAGSIDTYGTRLVNLLHASDKDISKMLKFLIDNAAIGNTVTTSTGSQVSLSGPVADANKTMLNELHATNVYLTDVTKQLTQLDPERLLTDTVEQLLTRADSHINRLSANQKALLEKIDKAVEETNEQAAKVRVANRVATNKLAADFVAHASDNVARDIVAEQLQVQKELQHEAKQIKKELDSVERMLKAAEARITDSSTPRDRFALAELKSNYARLELDYKEVLEQLKGAAKATATKLAANIPLDEVFRKGVLTYEQFAGALDAAVQHFAAFDDAAVGAKEALNKLVPPAVQRALQSIGMTVEDLVATGTKMLTLSEGLDSFSKSIVGVTGDVFTGAAGLDNVRRASDLLTSTYVKQTAALGTALEPLGRFALAVKMQEDNVGKVSGTGHIAAKDMPLRIQNDAAIQLFDLDTKWADGLQHLQDIMSLDIKTTSGITKKLNVLEALHGAAKKTANGIDVIPAAMLKVIDKPGWYYQFAAQIAAIGNGTQQMMMSIIDREHTFTDSMLLQRYMDLMTKNNGRTDIVRGLEGKILSVKALEAYAQLRGPAMQGLEPTALANMYTAEILRPLFTNAVDKSFDASRFSEAMTSFIIDYTDEAFSAVDVKNLSKAFFKYNELFTLLEAAGVNIEQFMQSYVYTIANGRKTFMAMDFTPVFRSYTKMSRGVRRWFERILGEGALDTTNWHGAFTDAPIVHHIDSLITEFNAVIKTSDDVAADTAKFVDKLHEISQQARTLATGGEVTEDVKALFGNMAQNTKKYADTLFTLARATDTLADMPTLVEAAPRAIRTVVDELGRLQANIALGQEVLASDVRSLSSNYKAAVEALHIQADAHVIAVGEELERAAAYLAGLDTKKGLLKDTGIPDIVLPFGVANIEEHLGFVAKRIGEVLADNTDKLGEEYTTAIKQILDEVPVPTAPLETAADATRRLKEQLTKMSIVDIEATGLPIQTAHGTIQPTPVQISAMNAAGESRTWYVNNGEDNAAILEHMRGISDDFAKSFGEERVTLTMLDTAKDIKETLREVHAFIDAEHVPVSAYNGSNIGGYDLPILNTYAPDGLTFKPAPDIMRLVNEEINRFFSFGKDMKLTEAFEIFVGPLDTIAHSAENDVQMAASVLERIKDGTVAQIAQLANDVEAPSALNKLRAAGANFRELNPAQITSEVAGTTKEVAEAAGKSVENFSTLSDAGKKVVSELREANLSDLTKQLSTLDETIDQLTLIGQTSPDVAIQKRIADALPELLLKRNVIANQLNLIGGTAEDFAEITLRSAEEVLQDTTLLNRVIESTTSSLIDGNKVTALGNTFKLSRENDVYKLITNGTITLHDSLDAAIDTVSETLRTASQSVTDVTQHTAHAMNTANEVLATAFAKAPDLSLTLRSGDMRKAVVDALDTLDDVADVVDEETATFATRLSKRMSKFRDSFQAHFNLNFSKKLETFAPKSFDEASEALTSAFINMKKAAAEADDYLSSFGKVSKELTSAYRTARAEYKVASDDFIKSLILTTRNNLSKATELDVDKLGALFSKKTDVLAYYFDKASGKIKLIGDQLYTNGDGLRKGLRRMAEAGEFGDEASKAIVSAFDSLDEAFKSGKGIHEAIGNLSEALQTGMADFAKGSVIYDVANDAYFAGAYAAKQVNAAAGVFDNSLKSVGKKLLTGTIGGYGIFDALDMVVSTALQHSRDVANKAVAAKYVEGLISTDSLNLLRAAGVDTGAVVADNIYRGAATAFKESFVINGVANLMIAAATAAVAGIPGLILGGVAAVAASAGLQNIVGHDDASMYYGNWSDALSGKDAQDTARFEKELTQSGKYNPEQISTLLTQARITDTDSLITQMADANGKLSEKALQAIVETVNANYDYNAFHFAADTPSDTIRGKNGIEDTLYGSNRYDGYHWWDPHKPYEGLYNGQEGMLPVRMLAAIGAIDAKTSLTSSGEAYYHTLALGVENAEHDLEQIKKVLGDDTLSLSTQVVEVDGKQYREVVSSNVFDPTKGTAEQQGYKPGAYGTVYASPVGGRVQFYDNDLETLEAAIIGLYRGGAQTGELPEQLLAAASGNTALATIMSEHGYDVRVTDAIENMGSFLEYINKQQNTSLTLEDLDANYGLGAAYIERQLQIQSAYEASKLGELQLQQQYGTGNSDVLGGNTAQIVAGVDTTGLSGGMIDDLLKSGIKLTEGTYAYSSELTGDASQTYLAVETMTDTIKEQLRGIRVDLTGTELHDLTVTAAEAEILAQAGIQINGDGSVTFMKAKNETITGNERDISLDKAHFSQAILDQMGTYNMSIDFDASEIDFGGFDTVKDKMSAALFDLSDSVTGQVSENTRQAIATVGTITEDGLLQITNKSILSGNTSMTAVLDGLDWYNVSDVVKQQLYAVAEQVDAAGASVQDNIIAWASGVVVPSPIKAEDLTEEVKAEFDKIGISFVENAGVLQMIISNTGEALRNGVTLIDTDTWNRLSAETTNALKALGVTWTSNANTTMVDLRGVMDAGIGEVVALFVDQPDVWAQLPDTVKTYLAQCKITSAGELLEIQKTMGAGLVELTDGWITAWDSLVPATQKDLAALGVATDNGMLSIKTYVEGAEIPELLDGEVLVPFDKLPEDIKSDLAKTGENVEGMKVVLGTAAETGFSDLKTVVGTICGEVGEEANQMRDTIVQAVTEAMIRMQQLTNLQGSFGKTGGFLGFGGKKNLPGQTRYGSDGAVYVEEIDAKGTHIGWWKLKDGRQVRVDSTAVPAKAAGGAAAGLTLAGELGRELAILPDGTTQLVGSGLYDFPEGTQIVNAADTADIIKYAGSAPHVQRMADGNTDVTVAAPEKTWQAVLHDEFGGVAVAIKNATEMLAEELSGLQKATEDNRASDIISAVDKAADSIREAVSNIRVEVPEIRLPEMPMLQQPTQGTDLYSYALSEIQAAGLDWQAATSDDERRDAHNRAEAGRAILGYSGGPDGSQHIPLTSDTAVPLFNELDTSVQQLQGMLDAQLQQLLALQQTFAEATQQRYDEQVTWNKAALDDAVLRATDMHAQLVATITDAGLTVANAVGSYVNWSQNTISSLQSQLSAMRTAMSEMRSGKNTIKANAAGGLVTGDQLVRVGEFGKEEAILPLEQPSVMAKLGHAISGASPAPVSMPSELREILRTELRDAEQITAVAIKNATDTLLADSSTAESASTKQLLSELTGQTTTLKSVIDAAAKTIGDGLDNISVDVQMPSAPLATESTPVSDDRIAFTEHALEQIKMAGVAYSLAETPEEKAQAHKDAEDWRALLGYTGGADGSAHQPLAGSEDLTTLIELVQKIITLATDFSTQATTIADAFTKLHTEHFDKNAAARTELATSLDAQLKSLGHTVIDTGLTVANAVGSYVNWSQSTIASLQSEVRSLQSALSAARMSNSTIKANAYGGMVTGDQLVRVGEFGKSEAIVPLEQPSVMAKLGRVITAYTPATGLVPEALRNILHAEVYPHGQLLAAAIKNGTEMLAEEISHGSKQQSSDSSDLRNKLSGIADTLSSTLNASSDSILSAIRSAADSVSSSVSSISLEVPAPPISMGGGSGGSSSYWDSGSSSSSSDSSGSSGLSADERASLGGSVYDQAHFTDAELKATNDIRKAAESGKTTWKEAHDFVESIRGSHGYSGGADGSKYKPKGSARGSLVTEDALYRAGELGLNEAIIPLEKPDVMKQVGQSIASFMPADAVGLSAAIGMQNGGVSTPRTRSYEPDVGGLVNRVTQSVMESVLPAMAGMSGGTGEKKTPVYVGTLIADERGLKQLERKLYVIRQAENLRRQ